MLQAHHLRVEIIPNPRSSSLRSARILVVDEALPVRRKMLEALHRAGVKARDVALAANADEAMEAYARDHPGVVFTELLGEDPEGGLGMIGEMLRIDPQVRIILLTAEDPDGALVRQAIRRGVFAIVPKPLRAEKIRQTLLDAAHEDSGVIRIR